MTEIEINVEDARISYEIINESVSETTIYRKVKKWVSELSQCFDYESFWNVIKKIKPSEDFKLKNIWLGDYGDTFFVKISSFDEDVDEETDLDG